VLASEGGRRLRNYFRRTTKRDASVRIKDHPRGCEGEAINFLPVTILSIFFDKYFTD
jgi:hypothetical protein